MLIQRKQTRHLIFSSFLNLTPDVLISFAVAYASKERIFAFLACFFGLQAVYLLVWLKNSVWAWVRFNLIDKDRMTQHGLDFLRENGFPAPPDYIASFEDYLQGVVDDNTLEIQVRLKAAAELGSYSWLRGTQQAQQIMRLNIAFEDALQAYHRSIGR